MREYKKDAAHLGIDELLNLSNGFYKHMEIFIPNEINSVNEQIELGIKMANYNPIAISRLH